MSFFRLFASGIDYAKKSIQPIFAKFGENVAHRSMKKRLGFGGNDTLRSWLRFGGSRFMTFHCTGNDFAGLWLHG